MHLGKYFRLNKNEFTYTVAQMYIKLNITLKLFTSPYFNSL